MSTLQTSVFFYLCASLVVATETDYYWREFTGSIPEDAITGGRNINDDNVFIGQAYIDKRGLIVAQIESGVKEVQVPIKGIKVVSKYVKILCGCQDNFSWLPSNSTNLHLDLLNKQGVVGGHEDGHGSINIGRISYEGSTQIGKINAFNVGNSMFRWANKNGKEPAITSYEVLIYEKSSSCKK